MTTKEYLLYRLRRQIVYFLSSRLLSSAVLANLAFYAEQRLTETSPFTNWQYFWFMYFGSFLLDIIFFEPVSMWRIYHKSQQFAMQYGSSRKDVLFAIVSLKLEKEPSYKGWDPSKFHSWYQTECLEYNLKHIAGINRSLLRRNRR
ncbi:MAG TPA: hypothetical protein VLI92_00010 [Candidatus Saccharimonadales bacterium]|nr:hypothetical protein [Candidatus Saccharimonadales bacterium]